MCAAGRRNVKVVVQLLLANGWADPGAWNSLAFRVAVKNGDVEMVKVLLADKRILKITKPTYQVVRWIVEDEKYAKKIGGLLREIEEESPHCLLPENDYSSYWPVKDGKVVPFPLLQRTYAFCSNLISTTYPL